jgi:hypothetical protein
MNPRASTAAMLRFAAGLVSLLLVVSGASARPTPAATNDALPRSGERLANPIWLPGCRMTITEWRSTAEVRAETTPSDAAVALMDATCRSAFARYGEFLRSRGLPQLRHAPDALPAISLLPGNRLLGGEASRALNDVSSRFAAVAPGCCYWGLYVDAIHHLFLRNDPLVRDDSGSLVPNTRFVRTFTHEISHILSAHLGVWDLVGYDRQRDEALAEDFVAFMGMHFPPETSAQDLAFHLGRGRATGSADGAEPRVDRPDDVTGPTVAPP